MKRQKSYLAITKLIMQDWISVKGLGGLGALFSLSYISFSTNNVLVHWSIGNVQRRHFVQQSMMVVVVLVLIVDPKISP